MLSALFQQKCHGTFLEPSGLLETYKLEAMCSFCLKSSIPTCAFPFGGLEALDEHAANAKWHSTHSWFFQWLRQRQEKAAKPQTFPVGLTLPWLEKVRAAYLMSGCDLAITLFAAQKFSGLRPEDADYPTLDLVEEIAVSMPLDASIRVRVRKEVAEVLLVKEIEKLNLRGVVPSLAAVYAMYEAFEPSSRCIGYRGRIAWVQRFRKRWGLSRRAWSCQPEIEKGKVGPQIWGR